jgi:hypothetical protein
MNTKRVDAAAGVIHAAMQRGKTLPSSFAYDLESAQLLQSPGRAAELTARRNEDMALRTELAPMGAPHAVPFELGDSLVPAVQWLIARVSERGSQSTRLVEENERLRARVAELEAERTRPAPMLAVTACLSCGEGLDDENITDFCSDRCAARRDASVAKLQTLLAGQRAALEDPHDSPLHHTYAKGRDLPEMPHA